MELTADNKLSIYEIANNEAVAAGCIGSCNKPGSCENPVKNKSSGRSAKLLIVTGEEFIEWNDALPGNLLLDFIRKSAKSTKRS